MNMFDRFKKQAAITAAAMASAQVSDTAAALSAPSVVATLESKKRLNDELGNPQSYAEIRRICGLPVCEPMTAEEFEEYNRQNVLAHRFDAGWRLFPTQAQAVCDYELYGGLFAPIGVGDGKTLISLMIAEKAFRKGKQRIILHVPPEILVQLVKTDIPWARNHVPLSIPIHVLGGRSSNDRRLLARSKRKGLYIIPYSLLSTKDTSDVLNEIQPEVIIADEAHRLGNKSSARTRRFLSCADPGITSNRTRPECAFMSGTITGKSIKDYLHLITLALRDNSPLPLSTHMAGEWAMVLDAEASNFGEGSRPDEAATGPLIPLVDWARRNFPGKHYSEDVAGFRAAYKDRLNTAPGVVSSGDKAIGTTLWLHNEPIKEHKKHPEWEALDSLIKKITDEWLTPNGDEIEHAIHTYKWLYELTAGFYNSLSWPSPEQLADRRGVSESEAAEVLAKAMTHHAAGQFYARNLRDWLESNAKPHLDTPFLVGLDMARNQDKNVDRDLYEAWLDWKNLDFTGRPDRDSHAVRVCDYKISTATRWASALPRNTGALLWVYHQEVGRWLYESLCIAGVDAVYCPAGDQFNAAILDPGNQHKKIVASISAHGTGKNLQAFQEQYFLQWPRSAKTAEQTLGRTHRSGQKADELVVFTNQTTEFDELNFAACVNDSLYIHQTTGNRQKLIYGNYDPLPKIFPPAVLRERGFQNAMLNVEQQQMLREKFGE